jgi:hypothetical protein
MAHAFEGRWQLNILNGEPDAEGNVFFLRDGALFIDETDEKCGAYEVVAGELILIVVMAGIDANSAWSMRARLPLTGALAGEHMLGSAEALFDGTDPIFLSECAFFRLHDVA